MSAPLTAQLVAMCHGEHSAARVTDDKREAADRIEGVGCFVRDSMVPVFERMGYFAVGVAEIELTLRNRDGMTAALVDGLRREQSAVRAEAEKRAMQLEERIQKVLAISFDGSAS